jgi:LysR family transcriptional regulator, hydrogen peroxide-inducible genes activator
VLHDLESARSEIIEKKTSIAGSISIGVIPTIAPYFLPSLLATFSRKYPEARVTIAEDITQLLLERLRLGTVDLAIVALPLQARSHDFQSFPLLVEKMFAVLPKQHALAKRGTVSLGELQDDPFLLLRDGHCFRETAVAACKRANLIPRIIFESGQFSSILSMVSAGLGVSVVPAMATEKRTGCRYVPLADGRAERTIGVITLNGRSPTRATEAFLAHLGATLR